MKITFGYAKDVLACFMFVLFAITIIRYRVNYNTNFVLLILFLSLILDGLFSVFPKLHNTEIKEEHFDQPFLNVRSLEIYMKANMFPYILLC